MSIKKISGIRFVASKWPLDPDKPTVVFIHGSGGSHRLWAAQVNAIGESVNTVAVDLPGHGASEGSGFNRVADYCESVLDFINAIDAPRPIPCGLSLGGAIVQQLLIDQPGSFPAGILVGTGARLKVLPEVFEAIEKDYDRFLAMLEDFAFSPATKAAVKKPVIKDTAKCDPLVTYGDFVACNGFDVMERLNEILVPVLVITAENDNLTPTKYGKFLESGIPLANRVHIAEAGHLAPVEQPAAFNRAVIDFIVDHGL